MTKTVIDEVLAKIRNTLNAHLATVCAEYSISPAIQFNMALEAGQVLEDFIDVTEIESDQDLPYPLMMVYGSSATNPPITKGRQFSGELQIGIDCWLKQDFDTNNIPRLPELFQRIRVSTDAIEEALIKTFNILTVQWANETVHNGDIAFNRGALTQTGEQNAPYRRLLRTILTFEARE